MLGAASPDDGVVGIPQLASDLRKRLIHQARRTLFVSSSGLENAKKLVSSYKQGQVTSMTPEIWRAKKIVDSTLHPGRWIQRHVRLRQLMA